MADMEEKVQYQSDERLRDVNEVLENCQTRVSAQNIFIIYHVTQFLIFIFIDTKNGAFISTTICDSRGN